MRGAEEIFSRRVYEQRGPRGLPAIGYPHWKSTVSEDTRQHGCCSEEVQYTHNNNAIEYDRFIARESYTLGLSPARPTARTKSVHPFTFLSTLHSETCKHRVCRYYPLAQFFFFLYSSSHTSHLVTSFSKHSHWRPHFSSLHNSHNTKQTLSCLFCSIAALLSWMIPMWVSVNFDKIQLFLL